MGSEIFNMQKRIQSSRTEWCSGLNEVVVGLNEVVVSGLLCGGVNGNPQPKSDVDSCNLTLKRL